MDGILIKDYVLRTNLKRTEEKGLLSRLSLDDLLALSLKYFGVYENGKLIGYTCPYSGKIITNADELIIEHIIPVSAGGGTVPFNCVIASDEVNNYSQKGQKHLLHWWINSSYWDNNAIIRLQKLVDYMFEGYDIFLNNVRSHMFHSSLNIVEDTGNLTQYVYTREEQESIDNDKSETGTVYYNDFINDCINILEENGIDVTIYREKLNKLINSNVFGAIEKTSNVQNILKQVIKDKFSCEDSRELTYLMYIDCVEITKSLPDNYNNQQIYNLLLNRINNIENILSEYNIGLESFFENIGSLKNGYLLTLDNITNNEIRDVIDNITLCTNDMLNHVFAWYEKNAGNLNRDNQYEAQLNSAIQKLWQVDSKKTKYFHTRLTSEQLKRLNNSNDLRIKRIYINILRNAIINNIDIDYIDQELKEKLLKIYSISNNFSKDFIDDLEIDEQIELYNNHPEIEKSTFIKMIEYFRINNEYSSDNSKIIKPFSKVSRNKNGNSFGINLSYVELKYLHDSNDYRLFSIYINILRKSIVYNIPLEYDDIELRNKFTRIYELNGSFSNNYIDDLDINEQKKIYAEHNELKENSFISLINWYESERSKGKTQPSRNDDYDKYGNKLITYYNRLFVIDKYKDTYVFHINLSKTQMEYLKNSNDYRLRNIYEERMKLQEHIKNSTNSQQINRSIRNDSIREKSIEEQRAIYEEHPELVKNKFIRFIEWFESKDNDKELFPSKKGGATTEEKQLRNFYESLLAPSIGKRGNHFDHDLSEVELKYLCDSKDIRLKMVYIRILEISILNNIPLRYTNEEIKKELLNMYSVHGNFNSNYLDDLSIDEQIRIYNDNSYLPKPKFISFIEWFNNPDNNDKKYPMQRKDIVDGYDLGVYLQQIKSIRFTKYNTPYFGFNLTYEQLKYLHDSKDDRLHDLYSDIMNKAIENGINLQYDERSILDGSRHL